MSMSVSDGEVRGVGWSCEIGVEWQGVNTLLTQVLGF
jgi:hypothetical protein